MGQITAIKLLEDKANSLLETVEDMARQFCYTDPKNRETDTGALSACRTALTELAEAGRFRILRGYGRMIVGYWPENDPEHPEYKALETAATPKVDEQE